MLPMRRRADVFRSFRTRHAAEHDLRNSRAHVPVSGRGHECTVQTENDSKLLHLGRMSPTKKDEIGLVSSVTPSILIDAGAHDVQPLAVLASEAVVMSATESPAIGGSQIQRCSRQQAL